MKKQYENPDCNPLVVLSEIIAASTDGQIAGNPGQFQEVLW